MCASCPVHLRNSHPNVSWRAATSVTVFVFCFWEALSQDDIVLGLDLYELGFSECRRFFYVELCLRFLWTSRLCLLLATALGALIGRLVLS